MISAVWKACVAGLALMAGCVRGHGYLADPAARNVQRNSDYCPQCLNGGGTWAVYRSGLPGRYGVCGDAYDGPMPHQRGPYRVAETYRAGGTLRARVVLTANHLGRWGLKLCPDPDRVSQGCFNAHVLRRSDGKGPWTRVPASKTSFVTSYDLPPGLRCERCVLQWTYETGNSCNLPGSPRIAGVSSCRKSTNWERFWNCADIKIS